MHHLQRLAVLSDLCILKMQNSLLLNTPIAWADKLKGAYLHSSIELEKRWYGCIVCRHRKDSPIRWVGGHSGGWLARFASVEASPSCSYDNIAVVKPGPYGGAAEAIPPLLAGVSWGWEAPLQEVGLLVWNGCVCMCACVHMCWLYEIKCDLFFRWKMKCTRGH